METDDYDSGGQQDIKFYAASYPESSATTEYGEASFTKRTISISGIISDLPTKVTIIYFLDGELQTLEQNITDSDDTSVDLPKGLCAFYAQLAFDYEVLEILADPPASPNTGDTYLVAAMGASGLFTGEENKIATWNGASYVFTTATDKHTAYDESTENYYRYYSTLVTWFSTAGETSRIIKTVKNDILLELE